MTDELLAAAVKAVAAANGHQGGAAALLGINRNTLASRLREARARGMDVPAASPDGLTLGEAVLKQRERRDTVSSAARMRDAYAEIGRLNDRIKELEWAAQGSFKPADWTLRTKRAAKTEHMPYLLTSDFQVGEVIRAAETDAGCDYDHKIFQARYRRLIETVVYLATEHAGQKWTYPGIIYARAGYSISGGIHDELRETDDLTPIQAVECCYEAEAWGIKQLAQHFGRVDCKTPGAGGNHDRNTLKPRGKLAGAHSYDRLICYMLRREFASDKRVTFQVSESPDVYFPIYDRRILLTHGDRIGSRGGHGFIGPAATILRGAQKVIMEQAALGRQVDRVDMGHFHTPLTMEWVICNGCLPGYSEFAKMMRMRPSKAQQMFLFHHQKHGVVDLKPIILE
jgi:hypothetical protein